MDFSAFNVINEYIDIYAKNNLIPIYLQMI